VGANVGDEVSVKVMFPTEYHAENLAGKAAEFKCKIHEIRAKSSYELDDTFAREIGGCETFAQMQQRMAQSMQAYADDQGEMQLQDKLMRMAAETLEFEPTEEQIRTEVEEQIQNMSAQLAQQGLTLELYCQFTGTTEEALRADTRNNAIASLRGQAAIEKIVALEALEATDEEIGQALNVIARQNRMTLEQLKPYIDDAFNAAVVRSVLTSKVMRLIRDAAEITEKCE
jgi:trigger factor